MPDTVAGLLSLHACDPRAIFAYLLDGDTTVTYAEQHSRSAAAAGALLRRGLTPGDRVHAQLGNCRQFYDLWFATAMCGAVFVPTNPQASSDELAHVLHDATPFASFTDRDEVDRLVADGVDAPVTAADIECESERLAAILYTSGTTSRAKGVMVSDRNYVAVGHAVANHLSVTADDRWLVVLPLFHANAQYYCTMSALVRGASIALAPRFSASRWGDQAHRSGATLASLFAAPIRMILRHEQRSTDRNNRVRTVLFAQNVADEEAERFEHRFATRLVQLYGMTETVLPPTVNPDDDTRRWSSIGKALPSVRIDLVDSDGVVSDDIGEMRIVSSDVAQGYWQDPEATRAVFTEAGLLTGDIARRDADGHLFFTDRSKDMIKRSGENVSASEIERVVLSHPAVLDSAAVGVPDPVRDEAIALFVVLVPGQQASPEDIREWCAHRLSAFKVPQAVHIVAELPRTSVGKIRKAELRDLLS